MNVPSGEFEIKCLLCATVVADMTGGNITLRPATRQLLVNGFRRRVVCPRCGGDLMIEPLTKEDFPGIDPFPKRPDIA